MQHIDPTSVQKGDQLFYAGKYEEAIKCYDQQLANTWDEGVFCNRAKAYYNLKKYEDALSSLAEVNMTVEVLLCRESEAVYIRGEIYYQQKNYEEAINNFKRMTRPDQYKPHAVINARMGLGNAYFATQKYAEAINAYSEYLEYDVYSNALVYQNRGRAYLQIKEYDHAIYNAIADFISALEITPKDPGIYCDLASCYNEKKQYKEALHAYQMCLKYDPTHTEAKKMIDGLLRDHPDLNMPDNTSTLLKHKIKKVSNQNTYLSDLKEAIFNTMSAYRLKVVELAYATKQLPVWQATKAGYVYEIEQYKWANIRLFPEVEKKLNDNIANIDKQIASVSNPKVLREKIAGYLSLLRILNDLKTKGLITEGDLAELKTIALFKPLVNKIEQVGMKEIDAEDSLPSSDPTAILPALETEFVGQAQDKITQCKDRSDLGRTLGTIGWLRKNLHESGFPFNHPAYRGDEMEKISLKAYRKNPKNYTGEMDVRNKVGEINKKMKESPDDFAKKKESINGELAALEAYYKAEKKRLAEMKADLKKQKIQESSVSVEIKTFRNR